MIKFHFTQIYQVSTGIYFEYFAFSPEKLLLLFTQKVRKSAVLFTFD